MISLIPPSLFRVKKTLVTALFFATLNPWLNPTWPFLYFIIFIFTLFLLYQLKLLNLYLDLFLLDQVKEQPWQCFGVFLLTWTASKQIKYFLCHDFIPSYAIKAFKGCNCMQLNIFTTQKTKFPIKEFFSKCDQVRRKLRIWSHLLKKYLMENFIFCTVIALHASRLLYWPFWSNRPEMLCKKGVLKNSAKVTGKHLRQNFSEHLLYRTPRNNCFWPSLMIAELLKHWIWNHLKFKLP